MSEYGTDCTTPVGRIVWGSPTKLRQKTHRTGPQKGQVQLDTKGQPINEISFGVAFPKGEFEAMIWPHMAAEIATGYPTGTPSRFAYKYVDADTVDDKGVPYSAREGYAGCIVLAYTQRINDTFGVPSIFKFNPQTGRYDQLGPEDIKCGDYVAVGTNFKVHVATGSDDTPSVYVNPKGIELVGFGTAIVGAGATDPNAMFGGQARALPAGASAVPVQQPGAPGLPPMAPPVTAPPPMAPPAPPAVQRPTDPTHIHAPGTPQEQWYINGAWQPAAAALPPPAPDFVSGANMPGAMPPR